MFFGSIPALVTPFSNGRVAEDTLRAFVEWQIAEGSNALVPCGTTGEVATLSAEEHREVVATTVEAAQGRVPVIAGCGSYSTAASIELARAAADLGADAALGGRALLQQAKPGGACRAFLCNCGCLGASDRRLQRAVAHRGRHFGRDSRRDFEASEDRRDQGCDGKPRARLRAAARVRRGFRAAQRQRRHGARIQRDGRGRLHFCDGQCGAAALLRISESDARGTLGRRR